MVQVVSSGLPLSYLDSIHAGNKSCHHYSPLEYLQQNHRTTFVDLAAFNSRENECLDSSNRVRLKNVDMDIKGDSIFASADLEGVTPTEVFDLLTNYEQYPRYFSKEKEITTHRKDGAILVDHQVATGIKNVSYTLKMSEDRRGETKQLSWTLDSSKLIAQLDGGWLLIPTPTGTHMELNNTSTICHKKLFGWMITDSIVKEGVLQNFVEIRDAMEKVIAQDGLRV